jgi:protein-S-isoprenylcysteine O-methyltransferase Ste14
VQYSATVHVDVLNTLAQKRVPLGFAAGALVLWFAQPTISTLTAGASIAVVGEGLRIWAAGHLIKAREVTITGPYRWFAHPLYVGSSIVGAGLALAARNLVATGIIALYLTVTLTAAIRSEESFLRRTFGDRYDRYRRGSSVADERRFSFARAKANHEDRALVGLLVAVLLLALKATYNGGSL